MPPYIRNPRITEGRPNHPCNYLPAKKIRFPYEKTAPDKSKYGHSTEAREQYAQDRYDYMERSMFNDSEEGQAERQEQEDKRLRRRKEEKKEQKEDEKRRKEQDKRLKGYGESSSKGDKEGRHGLLGGSSKRH
ncbi:hypothetical protein BGAL_0025g00090 [Botrytis galanthina]|uniref:Uncharacterized protein n=1 Tax=Botrytis galanthina TaxID=278940 RepID=A0A4S8RII0_9HELO|nr:hypothetical protein BGAL_0025g00090 [Botrytis galanthina]